MGPERKQYLHLSLGEFLTGKEEGHPDVRMAFVARSGKSLNVCSEF
jgi:hypothetical protein